MELKAASTRASLPFTVSVCLQPQIHPLHCNMKAECCLVIKRYYKKGRFKCIIRFLNILREEGSFVNDSAGQLVSLSAAAASERVPEWHGGGTGEKFSGSFLPFLCGGGGGGDSLVQRRHSSSSSSLTEEMEPQFILME